MWASSSGVALRQSLWSILQNWTELNWSQRDCGKFRSIEVSTTSWNRHPHCDNRKWHQHMASSSFCASPSDTDLILRYFIHRFCSSAGKCFSDRYFKANVVYVIYSLLLLHIDLNIGRESASDTMYILLGYIHILNGESKTWSCICVW